MDRRKFLQTSGLGLAAVSLSKSPGLAVELADQKKRVGLIGSGWYGKIDLLRLIQVAPVQVVSLCDVDKNMLADAADIVAASPLWRKTGSKVLVGRELLRRKRDAQGQRVRVRLHSAGRWYPHPS
jgi:hypothetical protein